jgi:CubicO group peptidase (beta-lactamase class C family)
MQKIKIQAFNMFFFRAAPWLVRDPFHRGYFLLLGFFSLVAQTACGPDQRASVAGYDTLLIKVPPSPLPTNAEAHFTGAARLDSVVERFRAEWQLKGVSLAIAQHGRLVYAQGFGLADEELGLPTTPQHRFRLASVSKLVTAVAIMQLVEAGKLRLTDKVFGPGGLLVDSLYLAARDPRVYQIEVQHLLRHTGGWRNRLRADPMFVPLEIAAATGTQPPASLEAITQYMFRQEMLAAPGTFFDYSNFGYCLLGKVIEQASGQSYEQYVHQHLLHPLGIKQMHPACNRYADRSQDEVRYYDYPGAKLRPSCYGTGELVSRAYGGMNLEVLGPAGGWVASPIEVLRFALAVDGFGTVPDLLAPQTVALMTAQNLTDTLSNQEIGWRYCGDQAWLRTGSFGGTHALLARQADGIAWAWVSNTSAWRGPNFSNDVWEMMNTALAQVDQWPSRDLFATDTLLKPQNNVSENEQF